MSNAPRHLSASAILWGVFALALGGCRSTDWSVDTSAIDVYDGHPTCDYTSLGPVKGRHGNLPRQGEKEFVNYEFSKGGNVDLALQRLKIAAMERGAEGVIVVLRDVTQAPPSSTSRAARHPVQQVIYRGIAIRDCE